MGLDLSPPTRIPSKEPTSSEEGNQFPWPIPPLWDLEGKKESRTSSIQLVATPVFKMYEHFVVFETTTTTKNSEHRRLIAKLVK